MYVFLRGGFLVSMLQFLCRESHITIHGIYKRFFLRRFFMYLEFFFFKKPRECWNNVGSLLSLLAQVYIWGFSPSSIRSLSCARSLPLNNNASVQLKNLRGEFHQRRTGNDSGKRAALARGCGAEVCPGVCCNLHFDCLASPLDCTVTDM